MPELPDLVIYVEALSARILNAPLTAVRITSPFVLRTYDPPIEMVIGRGVTAVRRLGKRIILTLEGEYHLVFHLMIAGRLRWRKPGAGIPGKLGLAAFDFPTGTLLLTEASKKKRAALHLIHGEQRLALFDRGGLEPLNADCAEFVRALLRENHTLKRALTDPRLFSGIGNAYSDEILHRARLSPFKSTRGLETEEIAGLHAAVQEVLREWMARLREEVGTGFPEKVTAFHAQMAVHGRYGQPCPICATPVQRIVYAENEANYCPTCQTGGRLLADRALSRLLKKDWPRTVAELEEHLPNLQNKPSSRKEK